MIPLCTGVIDAVCSAEEQKWRKDVGVGGNGHQQWQSAEQPAHKMPQSMLASPILLHSIIILHVLLVDSVCLQRQILPQGEINPKIRILCVSVIKKRIFSLQQGREGAGLAIILPDVLGVNSAHPYRQLEQSYSMIFVCFASHRGRMLLGGFV